MIENYTYPLIFGGGDGEGKKLSKSAETIIVN